MFRKTLHLINNYSKLPIKKVKNSKIVLGVLFCSLNAFSIVKRRLTIR